MKPTAPIVGFLVALLALAYGWWTQPQKEDSAETPIDVVSTDSGERIRVATFNVQVFGVSKLKKPKTIATLARIMRRFDLVAIQEIRSADQTMLDRFLRLVNSDGSQYEAVLGPRLGRTVSKEQYAFLYNSERIEVVPGSVYTVNDPQDLLHREPLVARFRVRGLPSDQAATFTLVNIHTDPDEVRHEINVLDNVIATVRRDGSGEDDVILLGDLNADERHYGDLLRVPNLQWAVQEVKTNTRKTKAYDNILFDGQRTREFTGRSGVFDIMAEFELDLDEALQVSDHLPVWAEFDAREVQEVAAADAATVR